MWLVCGVVTCAGLVGLFVVLSYWLQPPVVAISNLKYLQQLRTAVSSQRIDYVRKVDGAVDILKDKGQLNEEEYKYFKRIIETALAGDWLAADKACIKWENAQSNRTRPPEDTLDSDSHGHGHSHAPKTPPGRPNTPPK